MITNFEETKNRILDYLYDKLEMSEYKYNIIKNISDLYDLPNNKYYVSSNSCGVNSFLIFTQHQDNYYSYYVDRRSISYEKQYLKKKEVRAKEINISVSKELYNGTILDGIWIDEELSQNCRNNKNKNKYFIITDVFEFCGKKFVALDYKIKMNFLNLNFNDFYDKDKSNIKLIIQKPYELNNIDKLFSEYISKKSKEHNIKGISFYPLYSGTKLIYLFNKEYDERTKNNLISKSYKISNKFDDKENKNNSNNNYTDIQENSQYERVYTFRQNNLNNKEKNIIFKFKITKTSRDDEYNLYSIFYENNKYYMKKIDIAYIPNCELSRKMKIIFLGNNDIIFDCLLDPNGNGWIPLKVSEEQKIDIINQSDKINIIEELILKE